MEGKQGEAMHVCPGMQVTISVRSHLLNDDCRMFAESLWKDLENYATYYEGFRNQKQ